MFPNTGAVTYVCRLGMVCVLWCGVLLVLGRHSAAAASQRGQRQSQISPDSLRSSSSVTLPLASNVTRQQLLRLREHRSQHQRPASLPRRKKDLPNTVSLPGQDDEDVEQPSSMSHGDNVVHVEPPTPALPDWKRLIRGSSQALNITRLDHLKKEWCKPEPLTQIVRERGCLKRRVTNRFCYGQCNSFFIPLPSAGDDAAESIAFKSCSFCRPKKVDWISVVLSCPHKVPAFRRKRVQVVKQCACTALTFD